jgi:hypothetical protein
VALREARLVEREHEFGACATSTPASSAPRARCSTTTRPAAGGRRCSPGTDRLCARLRRRRRPPQRPPRRRRAPRGRAAPPLLRRQLPGPHPRPRRQPHRTHGLGWDRTPRRMRGCLNTTSSSSELARAGLRRRWRSRTAGSPRSSSTRPTRSHRGGKVATTACGSIHRGRPRTCRAAATPRARRCSRPATRVVEHIKGHARGAGLELLLGSRVERLSRGNGG